jgi:hypothetical protein
MTSPQAIPPVIRPVRGAWAWGLAGFLGAVLLLLVLVSFDPAQHGFYPRCYFKALTGLDCPGCGGLRAAHQFLHGNFRAAFVLNPFLILIGPLVAWYAAAELIRLTTGRELSHPFTHRAWLWALLVLLVGFGVVRNLPATVFVGAAP